jgi:hypothetical protein
MYHNKKQIVSLFCPLSGILNNLSTRRFWIWICFHLQVRGGRHLLWAQLKLKLKLKLRPTVSRPARLGVRNPSGTRGQFFFLLEIFFRQFRVCYFVAPSLTRGRVCNLLLLLVLASAVPLGSESRGTRDHILLSKFLRILQPGGPGPRIYIPQEQGGPDIPPALGSLSVASYDSQGLRWRYSIPPPHGIVSSLIGYFFIRDPTEYVPPSPYLKTETDPVSETFRFLVIYNSGRGTKSTNPVILNRQNPLEFTSIPEFWGRRNDSVLFPWTDRKLNSRHLFAPFCVRLACFPRQAGRKFNVLILYGRIFYSTNCLHEGSTFWDTTACTLPKIQKTFRRNMSSGQEKKPSKNQSEADIK